MPSETIAKKSAEEWLASTESEPQRERFKVFLGYAPGIGKTYSMLSEGIRRRSRGEDVVIGVVEAHGRTGTSGLAAQLEQLPRRQIDYRGTVFHKLDIDAVLSRAP